MKKSEVQNFITDLEKKLQDKTLVSGKKAHLEKELLRFKELLKVYDRTTLKNRMIK